MAKAVESLGSCSKINNKFAFEEAFSIAKKFAQMVHDELDPQAEVYLFGSAIRGENHKNSDIDIAVVSRVFTENVVANGLIVDRLAYALSANIDAQAIIFEDWVNTTPFTDEIKNKGRLVSL